ncbi:hypothetical protein ACSMXN_23125 [Jatrophihabitans sp. DSM 45814]
MNEQDLHDAFSLLEAQAPSDIRELDPKLAILSVPEAAEVRLRARADRSRRLISILASTALLVAVVGGVGLTLVRSHGADNSRAATGPAGERIAIKPVLKSPAQFRPLVKEPQSCPAASAPSGTALANPGRPVQLRDATGTTCYLLGPAIATITALERVILHPAVPSGPDEHEGSVEINLLAPQQQQMSAYAAQHNASLVGHRQPLPGDSIALVFQGEVLYSATVQSQIQGPLVVTGGNADLANRVFTVLSGH